MIYDQTKILPYALTAAIMLNTPFIIIPRPTIMMILSKIEQATGKKCECENESDTCFCYVNDYDYSIFKNLEFDFGAGYMFSIPATSFVKFSIVKDQKAAFLMILAPEKLTYIGLGTTFLQHYYLALNAETSTVSLGIPN